MDLPSSLFSPLSLFCLPGDGCLNHVLSPSAEEEEKGRTKRTHFISRRIEMDQRGRRGGKRGKPLEINQIGSLREGGTGRRGLVTVTSCVKFEKRAKVRSCPQTGPKLVTGSVRSEIKLLPNWYKLVTCALYKFSSNLLSSWSQSLSQSSHWWSVEYV